MRVPPAFAAALGAVALSACVYVYVERERPVQARPATVTTVPSATVVTPGLTPAPAAPLPPVTGR